jgi:hypothetical protein
MMGCINSEDETLIKRWWVGKKMNATGRMFKDEKKGITIKSCFGLSPKIVNIFEVLEFI